MCVCLVHACIHACTYINCPASRMTMDDPFKSPAYSIYLFLPLVYTVQCVSLSPTARSQDMGITKVGHLTYLRKHVQSFRDPNKEEASSNESRDED